MGVAKYEIWFELGLLSYFYKVGQTNTSVLPNMIFFHSCIASFVWGVG